MKGEMKYRGMEDRAVQHFFKNGNAASFGPKLCIKKFLCSSKKKKKYKEVSSI